MHLFYKAAGLGNKYQGISPKGVQMPFGLSLGELLLFAACGLSLVVVRILVLLRRNSEVGSKYKLQPIKILGIPFWPLAFGTSWLIIYITTDPEFIHVKRLLSFLNSLDIIVKIVWTLVASFSVYFLIWYRLWKDK